MFSCKCSCHTLVRVARVPHTELAELGHFMIYEITEHPAPYPSNDPICHGAGAIVDLHPRSTIVLKQILAELGLGSREVLRPLHDSEPVLA
jgi:hypothetical protein